MITLAVLQHFTQSVAHCHFKTAAINFAQCCLHILLSDLMVNVLIKADLVSWLIYFSWNNKKNQLLIRLLYFCSCHPSSWPKCVSMWVNPTAGSRPYVPSCGLVTLHPQKIDFRSVILLFIYGFPHCLLSHPIFVSQCFRLFFFLIFPGCFLDMSQLGLSLCTWMSISAVIHSLAFACLCNQVNFTSNSSALSKGQFEWKPCCLLRRCKDKLWV